MSKVCINFKMIFDDEEIWKSTAEFEVTLAKYFDSLNLLAERVKTNKNDDTDFYLYIEEKEEKAEPVKPIPSIKQSLKIVKLKAEGGEDD